MSYLQRKLAERYGLPADTVLAQWATAWTVDGVPPAGADATGHVVDADMSLAIIDYAVTAGRKDVDSNVEATVCQIRVRRSTAPRIPDLGDPVRLLIGQQLATALGLPVEDRSRFTGEVTDRKMSGDTITLTATGRRSRLGSLYVGDAPWPSEPDGTRADRILSLATLELGSLEVGETDPGTVYVLARDVDRKPALQLLEQLSQSADAQLVETRTGALEWHDAVHRLLVPPIVELTATELLSDLEWSSGRAGMVNTVTVEYGTAPPGGDRPTVTAVDSLAAGPLGMGPLVASITTELADADAAQAKADLLVARRSTPWWNVPRLPVDLLRTLEPAHLPALLSAHHGDAIRVTGLPSMHPLQTGRLMVEGYTEAMTPRGWGMELAVADAAMAAPPIRWDDLPTALMWDDVDPAVTWQQAARWVPEDPAQLDRWLDQPADLTWDDVDPDLTWAGS